MLLKDKVIVISGVGPGMGQAMARIAVADGAKVAIGARNQTFLDQVAADLTATGGEAVALATAVTMPISAARWRRPLSMRSGGSTG